ncbi:MAG: hypothetical protein GX032_04410 [Tenericutes bacterium]|nr:hypothetical protein [Mycoplasmatota bacterium]
MHHQLVLVRDTIDSGAVTYPSSCTAVGSGGASYTTCSVNAYRCDCSCAVPSDTWTTTWCGTQPCNQARCLAKNGCTAGIGVSGTYNVVTYKKTVYSCTSWNSCSACGTCETWNTCAACGCETWGGWTGWSTTVCTAAANQVQCKTRDIYN